jgi:hypothetical protein
VHFVVFEIGDVPSIAGQPVFENQDVQFRMMFSQTL